MFFLFPLLYYNCSFIYLYKGHASYIHISRGYVKHKRLRTTDLRDRDLWGSFGQWRICLLKMSDGAHFHVSRYVIRHNFHFWSEKHSMQLLNNNLNSSMHRHIILILCRIWGCHSSDYEEYNLRGLTPCSPLGFNQRFGGTYRLHLQGRRNKFSRKPASKQVASRIWFFAELISSTVKMKAICSSETSVEAQRATRRHIPEDDTLQINSCRLHSRLFEKIFHQQKHIGSWVSSPWLPKLHTFTGTGSHTYTTSYISLPFYSSAIL
jgi:hypothetical protein